MFEVQLEKLRKMEEEKSEIMSDIVSFLNNQINELRDNGIVLRAGEDTDYCIDSFEYRNGKIIYDTEFTGSYI